MKIGFDARMIDHPGIGRYIKNLLLAMLSIDKEAEFMLYGEPEKLGDFKGVRIEQFTAPIYSWAELFNSPFTREDFDITHIPHFNAPFKNTHNLVVTIHDFIYLKFPRFSTFLKSVAVRPVIANTIRNAKNIIVVSENTKRDVIENFPHARKKIRVVYEAADPVFCRITDDELKRRINDKYNLPDGFILYVGSLRKHKNIEGLISAYSILKSRGIKHKLVVVGRCNPEEMPIMKKILAAGALYLGEIPTDELAVVYNLATVFVLPSLYEGFGLPVLEAMSCGVPVVASCVASLPEVIGDAGIMINPRDSAELADKIEMVITSDSLRQEFIAKGLKRTERFSWNAAARETLNIYKEALQ